MTSNSAVDLNDLYTRRAHHSGVLSGHELLSYSFLGGQACEPRRSIRRKHRSRLVYIDYAHLVMAYNVIYLIHNNEEVEKFINM